MLLTVAIVVSLGALSIADDRLFILLDTINTYECDGIVNKIDIQKRDISIRDELGNKVRYIKAPGEYHLSFDKIKVNAPLENVIGEIAASLQVPVFQGPVGLRFDVPYSIIPQGGQSCDAESGVVQHGQRKYCRYCTLCDSSKRAETTLREGRHKFDATDAQTSTEFHKTCNKVNDREYKITRKIVLPGKAELEKQAEEKFGYVDEATKDRLREGNGKFQVFLNLIGSSEPSQTHEQHHSTIAACRCCLPQFASSSSCAASWAQCKQAACNTQHAQTCLRGEPEVAGCMAVEFNYKVTLDYADVTAFLRQRGLTDEQGGRRPTTKASSHMTEKQIQAECVASIDGKSLRHVVRFCETFWDRRRCCEHCPNVSQCKVPN